MGLLSARNSMHSVQGLGLHAAKEINLTCFATSAFPNKTFTYLMQCPGGTATASKACVSGLPRRAARQHEQLPALSLVLGCQRVSEVMTW